MAVDEGIALPAANLSTQSPTSSDRLMELICDRITLEYLNQKFNQPNRRGTDPYARWCGTREVKKLPPIPDFDLRHWMARQPKALYMITG
jgi:hypothetical protein